MAGLTDYAAQALLNHITGALPLSTNYSRFLALFTTAPTSDAGTGGTEVSGGSYARVQVAGRLQVSASSGAPSTSAATITLSATAPAWLLALGTNGSGCNVYDATAGGNCGTISSVSGTTITLTGNSAIAGALSDFLYISAFPLASASSTNEPSTSPANVASGAAIAFAQSSASWGTVDAYQIYDASSSGNAYIWDYLGNYKWYPFTCTSASPGVLTVTDTTFANSTSVVVTAKFGGTLPATSGSWAGVLTTAGASGNTFNVAVNTTGIGDGMVRQVLQQSVPINTTVTFSANQIVLTSA